ncbi:hypothetical protein HPB49_011751 [Dermacentor silvarum]|uniref:Uncharacterized protein n=1 Tax=Dermacentor silvarum TaxID=543639 RepID=A0ACB8CX41_DERSI|nr:hypothetical protein HPB49_011751 [Dermacentor silvarum]
MVRDGLDEATGSRLGPSKHAGLGLVQRPHLLYRQRGPIEGKREPGRPTSLYDISIATIGCLRQQAFRGPSRQVLYREWVVKDDATMTPTGRRMKAPLSEAATFVKDAWEDQPAEMIKTGLKKCSISNALDGTEDDDAIWDSANACEESDEDNFPDSSYEDLARSSDRRTVHGHLPGMWGLVDVFHVTVESSTDIFGTIFCSYTPMPILTEEQWEKTLDRRILRHGGRSSIGPRPSPKIS